VSGPDLTRLRAFLIQRFPPRGAAELTPETPLVTSGRLDSFGIVELVAFIEGEYGVRLRDEDLVPASFETLEAIGRMIARAGG
jgi:acyl carrier protein